MAGRKNFALIFPRRNDPPIVEGFENLQLPTTVSWRKSTRRKNPQKMNVVSSGRPDVVHEILKKNL